ncbi:hypothetical protein Zm00014a_006125 [Zea mays]|uniref:Uncharacterized protein n=1 Tax=Zea mays TaxID=4577 RepID=A0A3L6F569_MAIZE|nr:hypothetical protein Zm00014a_006125 [Zea mays]
MEGKTGQLRCCFVAIVLVLGLVLEQSQQAEARGKWCCETATGKYHFNRCVDSGWVDNIGFCASNAGCIIMEDRCGGRWPVPARDALSLDVI